MSPLHHKAVPKRVAIATEETIQWMWFRGNVLITKQINGTEWGILIMQELWSIGNHSYIGPEGRLNILKKVRDI